MKVIHIVPDLSLGGVQTFTLDLAAEQVTAGSDVTIISLTGPPDPSLISRCVPELSIENLDRSLKAFNVLLMFDILKLLMTSKPSVVHTHGIANYFCLAASVFLHRTKFVHTIHNLAHHEAGTVRRYLAGVTFRWNTFFPVTISDEVTESFEEYYQHQRFLQINNGLTQQIEVDANTRGLAKRELDNLKRDDDTLIYISVGRFDYQKNRKVLIDAFYRFATNRNVILVIIGGPIDGTHECYDSLLSHPAIKEKVVHFIGWKSNVHDYLELSDFFCLSSLFEGLPISVLEAIRAGLICVCTPAGGMRSLVGEIGYVSSGFDAASFQAALIESELNPRGLNRALIREFFMSSWDMKICEKNYRLLYQNLINS